MFDIEKFALNFKHDDKPANYQKWVDHYDAMKVHTRGDYPKALIDQTFPQEPEEFKKYRQNNFRAITKGSMLRFISDLHSFLHDANYSYDASDSLNEYLQKKTFAISERENLDFWQYLSKLVLRRHIEDANGLLVWLPEGDGMADPSVKAEVKPLLVECYDIHSLTSEVACYLSDELSEVRVNNDTKLEGKVFHAFTADSFYKIVQIGEKFENKFRLDFIYKHNIGTPPVIVLGGEEINGYFESYAAGFLEFGNEAIIQFSQTQATMLRCAFPHIEEAVVDCNACNGTGDIHDPEKGVLSCTKCHGDGKLVLRSPLGTYQRNVQKGLIDGDQIDSTPPIRFHAPDTAIINLQREAYKDYLEAAEKTLSLNPPTDLAQSGVAKEYDRQEKYALKVKISNNFFDNIYFNSLWFVEKYRNISNPQMPVIYKPTDMDIETEADLMMKMQSLNDSKAPTPFRVEAIKALAKKSYPNSEVIQKVIDVISDYDVLFGETDEDIALQMASGIVDTPTAIKHRYAYKIVNRIASDDRTGFLKADYATLEAKIDAAMAKYIPAQPTGVIKLLNDAA